MLPLHNIKLIKTINYEKVNPNFNNYHDSRLI